MAMDEEKGSSLFAECIIAIISSKELPARQARELAKKIEERQGQVVEFKKDGSIENFEEVTHIVSATTDFAEYPTARQWMVPVVIPAWISQSIGRSKQAPIRPYSPDPKLFFSNVNMTTGDIPNGDRDAITGAVLAMGGMESSSLTKLTTHICALSMDHPKCQMALQKHKDCKIVLPHWFDDCLKLGKRIDERPYLLPDPEIFRVQPGANLSLPVTNQIDGAISPRPEFLPTPTDTPVKRHLTVFQGKQVMISEDLNLGSRLRGIIEDLITGGEGHITNSVHNADIYVCHYREGRDYVFASRANIDVGNLSWLYHLITHNEWTSPFRRLLHYPIPKNGIEGFGDFRITLSNYGGEARIYLENLVLAAGGEFTKSMKQDNTHLITARKSSEKCQAAEEWNINMVNHLWLEESYAKCQVQTLTDPRYNHFPPRTNLGEIIGQTQLDTDVLRLLYFPQDPTPSPSDPKTLRKPVVRKPDLNTSGETETDEEEEELPKKKTTKPILQPRPRGRPSGVSQGSTPISRRVSTPVSHKTSFGKENETPSSTRSAKDKALSKLHDLAPDIALYERENKRKGHVWGGDRAANQVEKSKAAERSSSPADVDDDGDVVMETRPAKKQRTMQGLPPVDIRLLITGYKQWYNNLAKEDSEKKKLRELGVLVVTDPMTCTHMAAPAMVRTQKFLCALANGPMIVSSDFIDACVQSKERPDPEDFLLEDKENEKKFNLKLKEMITRAKANKHKLLHQVAIYCTAEIMNGWETYKAIAEVNGATFLVYRARGGATIRPTKPEDEEGPPEPVYLISGPKESEKALWPKFLAMAKRGNMEPRIVHSEWLLDCALSQRMKWDRKYLASK